MWLDTSFSWMFVCAGKCGKDLTKKNNNKVFGMSGP